MEQSQAPGGGSGPDATEGGSRQDPGGRGKVSEGIRQGLGVLSALKDALEETIQEARARGDLSPEKARETMRAAMSRAQEVAGEARERLDFVPRSEYERLRERMEDLQARLEAIETRAARNPDAGSGDAQGPAGTPGV